MRHAGRCREVAVADDGPVSPNAIFLTDFARWNNFGPTTGRDTEAARSAPTAPRSSLRCQLRNGTSSPPCDGAPIVWCGSQFLSPLMPTRFFNEHVIPAFLCVLSFGRLMKTSASIAVRPMRYSCVDPEWMRVHLGRHVVRTVIPPLAGESVELASPGPDRTRRTLAGPQRRSRRATMTPSRGVHSWRRRSTSSNSTPCER